MYYFIFSIRLFYYSIIKSTEIKEGEKDLAIMVITTATKDSLVAAFLSHGPVLSSSTMAQHLFSAATTWCPSATTHSQTHILCHHIRGYINVQQYAPTLPILCPTTVLCPAAGFGPVTRPHLFDLKPPKQ